MRAMSMMWIRRSGASSRRIEFMWPRCTSRGLRRCIMMVVMSTMSGLGLRWWRGERLRSPRLRRSSIRGSGSCVTLLRRRRVRIRMPHLRCMRRWALRMEINIRRATCTLPKCRRWHAMPPFSIVHSSSSLYNIPVSMRLGADGRRPSSATRWFLGDSDWVEGSERRAEFRRVSISILHPLWDSPLGIEIALISFRRVIIFGHFEQMTKTARPTKSRL